MQARNLTTNVPKILDLKSSSEQVDLGRPRGQEPKFAFQILKNITCYQGI